MTPEQFTYWLQGYLEMSNAEYITPQQTTMIKEHLALVLTKVTPPLQPYQHFYPNGGAIIGTTGGGGANMTGTYTTSGSVAFPDGAPISYC